MKNANGTAQKRNKKKRKSLANLSSSASPAESIERPIRSSPRKKLLVLDLDETLVHSSTHSFLISSNNTRVYPTNSIELFTSQHPIPILYYIYKRPHLNLFLEKISQWFDLAIFTASVKKYADFVIENISLKVPPELRFFRDSCEVFDFDKNSLSPEQKVALQDPTSISAQQILIGKFHCKNLKIVCEKYVPYKALNKNDFNALYSPKPVLEPVSLTGSELDEMFKDVFIIDNSPSVFSLQPANGFPIKEWICEPNDCVLLDLLPVLEALRHVDDVRNILGLRLFRHLQK